MRALIRRHSACIARAIVIICMLLYALRVFNNIESSMYCYYYCHCGQVICLLWDGCGIPRSAAAIRAPWWKPRISPPRRWWPSSRCGTATFDQSIFPTKRPCTLAAAANAQAEAQASRVLHPFRNHQIEVGVLQCNAQVKRAFAPKHAKIGHRVLQELVLLRLMNSSGDSRQIPVIQKDLPRLYC